MSTAVFSRAPLPVLVFSTNSILIAVGVGQKIVAVAFFDADFLQQFAAPWPDRADIVGMFGLNHFLLPGVTKP